MLEDLHDVVLITEEAAFIAYSTSLLGLALAPNNKYEARDQVDKAVRLSTVTRSDRLRLEC